jgi:hypothetical protein
VFHLLRQLGVGSAPAATLRVCHETRKALEAAVSGVATCTVSYPNRPFTLPANAVWYRVRAIQWENGTGLTIGNGSRWGVLGGRFTVEVWQREGLGYGTLNPHADILRDAFNRARPTTTSGMELQMAVPGGPRPVSQPGWEGVAITMPFQVTETITS